MHMSVPLRCWVSYAQILVERDVTKDIPQNVQIEDPNGRKFAQKVVYDWLPPFFLKCQGHNSEGKRKVLVKITHK